ncbi:sensor histidine kinase [Guptibacillus spartinae]|uniref:sensor histidine kinase n=1 Tax=Guptibacillus spartinae TaxID=3025679 RepID=UPI00235E6443|nr:HAMP domain-containing sensor histidine kinase [Pseudalkalibacillus spartinae]
MRHSIERKILVPFLIIVLIPIFIIGAVSMWSSYQSEKQLKQATVQEHLTSLDRYATKLENRVNSGMISEEEAKSLIKMMINETKGLYVEEADGTLSTEGEVVQASELDWYNGEAKTSIFTERTVLTKQIEQWGWTLYHPMTFSFYSGSLPNIQKYTLLISIFTGVIAVQFTIILSYHLSKPIKNLAAFCKKIALGERTNGVDIDNRKDEIGVLSSSLKDMVETLDERNAQIDKIKKLNETILNSVHVGMVLVIEGADSVYNEAAQTMMNEDPLLKERLGKLTIHETKRRSEEIWDHKRKEEKVFYAVSYKVLGTSEKQRSIITFEDITHRRKLEQRVERMSRLASLGEMASGIAHEIRNPLAGIKTTTELLTRRLELTKDQLILTENMLLDIDRVNKIITNILQFSRPMETNPSLLKVDDTLHSLVLLMKTIADDKKVVLHHIENNTEIFVDRDHLRQILLNLILNGMNAMPDGGELILSSFQRDDDVTILISDTGVGMEDAVMEKIFDPFYTTRAEGTGLGLSIVHQLVVQNNGEIDVNSIKGKGTEFSITFPIGREEK